MRTWAWVALATLLLVRIFALDRAEGQRDFGVPPLTSGPCQVAGVASGDTLLVVQDPPLGQQTVRLLSTDAAQAERDGDELAAEARRFAEAFVASRQVRLSFDSHRLGADGSYLAYVEADGELLNEALLAAGLARYRAVVGHSAPLARRLKEAEEAARAARAGIWKAAAP